MSTDNTEVEKKDQTASPDQGVETKDSKAPENQDKGIDYKAELERVTAEKNRIETERDNYKQGMLNAKDILEKKGKKSDDDDNNGADNADDIDAKIDAKVNERLSEINRKVDVNTFDSVIGELSTDADEQALIKYHFEHSVSPNLSIRERIENAKLIANKPLILKTQSELATALKNKMGVSRISTAAGGNQDAEKVTKEFWSPEQLAALKKRGLDPEKVKENYLKLTQKK